MSYKQPTKTEIKAIQQLCSYLHDVEKNHWLENDQPINHIYQHVRIVERYLKENKIKITP